MKKWLLGLVLAVSSAVAFALPSPHQIEDALATQHYSDARSMVQQVLEEKPDSARAHLLDAYILIHVDHNKQAASQELDNARRLDKKGDVANSPLFGRTAAEIDMTKASAKPAPAQQQAQPAQGVVQDGTQFQPQPKHEGHPFLTFLLFVAIIGLIGYILYLIFRRPRVVVQERHVYHAPTYDTGSVASAPAISVSSAPRVTSTVVERQVVGSAYVSPPAAPVIINNGGGYGRGYGNDGFVEGMLIGEMMEENRETRRELDADRYERRRERDSYSSSSSSYDASPSSSEPSTSYASDRQSFSSGSDDSWSSRSSSSSSYSSSSSDSSSSWSSGSSWDSGSSSSYDSGSSSWDSGSSSSGSDW